ncbi:MAG: hypothetical protein V1863_06675 [Candidatus Omnitrophota bacterium]
MWIRWVGLVAGIILPFWNIPLIWRIQRRRSSQDISLFWAVGVWVCLVLMFPSACVSADIVYKAFSWVNIVLFTIVMVQVARFSK